MTLPTILRASTLAFATLLLCACGTFHHSQQTYYVHATEDKPVSGKQSKPSRLGVQVVPSTKSKSIPMLYHSREWGAPYFIRFHTTTDGSDCPGYLIHSIKLYSEATVFVAEQYVSPLKLHSCSKRANSNDELYRYKIGNALDFEKGRKIMLEVEYEQPGLGKRRMKLTGTGKEENRKYSLFDAYMSV